MSNFQKAVTRKFSSFTTNPYNHVIPYPDIEFECKVEYKKSSEQDLFIEFILHKLETSEIRLDSITYRTEYHHFYSNESKKMHRAFIFVCGSTEIWIKEKTHGEVILTPELNIPVLVRIEKKLKPIDQIYDEIFLDTLNWDYEGSFEKKCTDISFWSRDHNMTFTFSKANNRLSSLTQVELEYDGHVHGIERPSKQIILKLFDDILGSFQAISSSNFVSTTKLKWLRDTYEHHKASLHP